MQFMRLLILLQLIVWTSISYSQEKPGYPTRTFKIDTLIFEKDTSNLFVREIWDTTIVKSYYCSSDSIEKTIHYGFLHLKKGLFREYRIKNVRDVIWFPIPNKYEGYRGPDIDPIVLYRLN